MIQKKNKNDGKILLPMLRQNDKILALSKLKACANTKLNVTQNMKSCLV